MLRQRSVSDLLKYSADHIAYEFDMLDASAQSMLTDWPPDLATLRNALIESFAIHLRNVISFMEPGNIHPDDILADHYVPRWRFERRGVSYDHAKLAELKRRAHKDVAHMTFSRLTHPKRPWDPVESLSVLRPLLEAFLRVAPADARQALHPKAVEALRRLLHNHAAATAARSNARAGSSLPPIPGPTGPTGPIASRPHGVPTGCRTLTPAKNVQFAGMTMHSGPLEPPEKGS